MRRRTLSLALPLLFGLIGAGAASPAHAFGGGHRGQTYHYNGIAGYWTAPPASYYANCSPGYAAPAATYAPRPAYYYAPAPATYAPAATNAVYAPTQSPWYPAVSQR